MTTAAKTTKKSLPTNHSVLAPLILLTLVFFLGQYIYQIYQCFPVLQDGEIYQFFTQQIIYSGILDISILYFFLIQISLIASYILILWLTLQGIGVLFQWTRLSMRRWGIVIWILCTVTLCMTHEYLYPHSKFAIIAANLTHLEITLSPLLLKYTVLGLVSSCVILVLLALAGWIIWCTKHWIKATLILIAGIGTSYFLYPKLTNNLNTATNLNPKSPHIILINLANLPTQILLDSRLDQIAPYIRNFLNQSTYFTHNIAPAAQEFPNWISIFTGEYPTTHGFIHNHMKLPEKITNNNLIKLAGNKGYQTFYIADSSRFSKMRSLGSFNTVNSPPENVGNILLGMNNDFIISNLLVNTALGPYLFPFNYGNRDTAESYDPKTLSQRLQQALTQYHNAPVFLVLNMSLANWPYKWRTSETYPAVSENVMPEQSEQRYQAAINQLDLQFNDIMTILKQKGLLQDSLVIVFSTQNTTPTNNVLLTTAGYVGNLENREIVNKIVNSHYFSKKFHSLLAMQFFNPSSENISPRAITDVTSLMDIYATLAELLNLDKEPQQGMSLLPVALGQVTSLPKRTVLFENQPTISQSLADEVSFLDYPIRSGLKLLQINCCTGVIELKPSLLPILQQNQSYGQITYPNILLPIPPAIGVKGEINYHIPTKTWTLNE